MPLTRIKNSSIGDDGVTTRKLDDTDGGLTLPGAEYVKVPVGTTAQRPSTAEAGQMRFNTDNGTLEQYNTNTSSWVAIDSPPIITSVAYSGSLTAADPAGGETITVTGSNFLSGVNVEVGGTSATSVTRNSSTELTFVTPAKTAGDYDVVVRNTNGLQATSTDAISYNGVPTFTSPAAGNIGNLLPDVAMTTITIVASEPDSGTLAYSVTTGSLPTGLSLGSANGEITGTPTGPTSETTSNFTVTVTDDENQTTTRNYNLLVYRPVFVRSLVNSVKFDTIANNWLSRDNTAIGSGMPAGGDDEWTISCWIKKERNTSSSNLYLIGADTGTNARFTVDVNGQSLRVYGRNSSNVDQFNYYTDNVIYDSRAWYHVMIAFDSNNSTANDRIRFYVNGTRVDHSTGVTVATAISQGYGANGNALQQFLIGKNTTNNYSDGYIADYHWIYGTAKTDPYEFIESYRGEIIPKAYTGSYGTYGFHLDFADSSDMGADNAGIGDFTLNDFQDNDENFNTVSDTPTNNWATLNDWTSHNGGTINKALLRSTKSSARYAVAGTMGVNTGKWYWEVYSTHWSVTGGIAVGLIPSTEISRADMNSGDINTWGAVRARLKSGGQSTYIVKGGSSTNFGASGGIGSGTDTWGFSVNFDDDEFVIHDMDGSTTYTIDISSVTDDWMWYLPTGGNETGSQTKTLHWNFGQSDFKITGGIPSGFKAFKESNKTEPAITPITSSSHAGGNFEVKTYTGDGETTQAITGVGFKPDLIISKKTDATYNWSVYDSCRGANKRLNTNTTGQESTEGLTSFDSDGFTINNTGSLNASGDYVAYCWKAGGAPTAANTATSGAMTANSVSVDGTLQSAYTPAGTPDVYPTRMSVNTEAGFSVVQYNTGSNNNNFTVPHGLGKKPKVIWTKGSYDGNDYNWDCYNYWTPTSSQNYNGHLGRVKLNTQDGFTNETGDVPWGDTTPTDDVWTVGNSSSSNADWYGTNKNNIAYVWTDVPGFSDFGFYRGNGNSTGAEVYVGFRPRLVIIKNLSTGSTSWSVFDSAREDEYNMFRRVMFDSTSAANTTSSTTARIDIIANGFRSVGGNGSYVNTDGDAYMYMAFAEMPAKYASAGERADT